MIGDVIEIERAKYSLPVVEDAPSIVSALPDDEAQPESGIDAQAATSLAFERWLSSLKQLVGIGRSPQQSDGG